MSSTRARRIYEAYLKAKAADEKASYTTVGKTFRVNRNVVAGAVSRGRAEDAATA